MISDFVLTAGDVAAQRGALFDRVDRFAFADPRRGSARWTTLSLGKATISEMESTGHATTVASECSVTLLATVRGQLVSEQQNGRLVASAGGSVVLGPGHRKNTACADEGGTSLGIGIAFGPEAGRSVASGFELTCCGAHAAADALLGFARYALAQARRPDSPFLQPRSLNAAEAMIADGALALALSAGPAEPAKARRAADKVRAAEAFIREYADEPLTVEGIARAVGVGPRALHAAFREHLDTTPRALLTEVRLERARERLLAPEREATVTDAALASGFAHLGRFALTYRRRFGESPSDTLQRARAAGSREGSRKCCRA